MTAVTPKDTIRTVERRDRQLDQLRAILGVIAVGMLGVLVWSVVSSRDVAEDAVTQTQDLAAQVATACDSGGAAARELEAIGACDDAEEAARGIVAEQPTQQPVATDDQVRTAVTDYLRENPPADGRTPSAAEVESAVTRVCQQIGCQGEPGTPGQKGDTGNEGPEGAPGRDATDEQVAAQVAAYCAVNNGCLPTPEEIQAAVVAYCSAQPSPCVGPPGAEGPPGPLLPEYRETDGGVTRLCVLQPPEDAEAPPHYECTLEAP